MNNETAWICITAMAIVGIVALALVLKGQGSAVSSDGGVLYKYDEQNRLSAITPLNQSIVKLTPVGE